MEQQTDMTQQQRPTSTVSTTSSPRIKLQIGEKTFHTTQATVSQSGVLSTLCSLPPPSDDGVYFLDADPELFEHILRYLRTGMFPIFYDPSRGHDFALYLALLAQARFYQLPLLENWLANRCYLEAIARRTWVNTIRLCGYEQIERLGELTHLPHEELQVLSISETNEKCWKCPKKEWRHNGRRNNCIRDGCISRISGANFSTEMRVITMEYVVTAVQLKDDRALPTEVHEDTLVPPPYDAEAQS